MNVFDALGFPFRLVVGTVHFQHALSLHLPIMPVSQVSEPSAIVIDTLGVVLPASEPEWRIVLDLLLPTLSVVAACAASYAAWKAAQAAQQHLDLSLRWRADAEDRAKAALRSHCRTLMEPLRASGDQFFSVQQGQRSWWFSDDDIHALAALANDVAPRVSVIAAKATRNLRYLLTVVSDERSRHQHQAGQPDDEQLASFDRERLQALRLLDEIVQLCPPPPRITK